MDLPEVGSRVMLTVETEEGVKVLPASYDLMGVPQEIGEDRAFFIGDWFALMENEKGEYTNAANMRIISWEYA